MSFSEIYEKIIDSLDDIDELDRDKWSKGNSAIAKLNRLFYRAILDEDSCERTDDHVDLFENNLVTNKNHGGDLCKGILEILLNESGSQISYLKTICDNIKEDARNRLKDTFAAMSPGVDDTRIEFLVFYLLAQTAAELTLSTTKKNSKKNISPQGAVGREILSLQKKLKESLSLKDTLVDRYYVEMWEEYHRISPRDGDKSLQMDLIRFFMMPQIRNFEGKECNTILSSKHVYLYSDSGLGKTTFVKAAIVSELAPYIYENHRNLMTKYEVEAFENSIFTGLRKSLGLSLEENLIPIYIEAKAFNEKQEIKKLEELASFFSDLSGLISNDKSKFFIAVDSIDEVRSDLQRTFINKKLNSLVEDFKASNIVITTRFSNISANSGFSEGYIEGFGNDEVFEYVDKFNSNVGEEGILVDEARINAIKQALANDNFMTLAQNRFFLTEMIVSSVNLDNFKETCERLIITIINKRFKNSFGSDLGLDTDDDHTVTLNILGYLAFETIFKNDYETGINVKSLQNILKDANGSDNEAQSLFVEYGEKLKDEQIEYFVKNLSCQSGVLSIKSIGIEQFYTFQDILIKCYLAARYFYRKYSQGSSFTVNGASLNSFRSNNRSVSARIIELITLYEKLLSEGYEFKNKQTFICFRFLFAISQERQFCDALSKSLLIEAFMSKDNVIKDQIKECLKDALDNKFGSVRIDDRDYIINRLSLL